MVVWTAEGSSRVWKTSAGRPRSFCTAHQVITALRIIMGEDGTDIGATKLKALRENSNFVRR